MPWSLNHLMPKVDFVLSLILFLWISHHPRQRAALLFGCVHRSRCLLLSLQTWSQISMRKRSRANSTSNKLMHQCLKRHGSDNARTRISSPKIIWRISNRLNKKRPSLPRQSDTLSFLLMLIVNNFWKSTSKMTKHWYSTRRYKKILMTSATLTRFHSFLTLNWLQPTMAASKVQQRNQKEMWIWT